MKRMTPQERIAFFRRQFPAEGFFQDREWVLSARPFPLPMPVVAMLEELGPVLRRFQRACNRLYLEAAEGGEHAWVAALLDRGKPESVVELGRHRRWADDLAGVIRPDLMLTAEGVSLAELDSLPGGMGLTAWLNETFAGMGEPVIGGGDGMVEAFRRAFPAEDFVVSRESADYEPEMRWLASRLGDERRVWHPWSMDLEGMRGRALYRFFELFDLPQVEQSDALLALAKSGEIRLTAPPKAFMEEKLWLALFWSPTLRGFWQGALGTRDRALLERVIPRGWVVDPAPLPPFAEIDGLGVADWEEVAKFGRKERELVLKISGFSELGWGSRGVAIGQDLAPSEWQAALRTALQEASHQPRLLQRFHAAKVVEHEAWDESAGMSRAVASRVRLCPYYFAHGADEVTLGGVLATVCPADKKLLHGMRDAMMLPCVAMEEAHASLLARSQG